jgi:hypothetical protein
MNYLEQATALAASQVPERYQRTAHPHVTVWDASKDAYVTVERPSKHIAAMRGWVQDRIRAKALEAAKNAFNPSRYSGKVGAREAAKEANGLFGYGAGGFDEKPAPIDDLGELLQELRRLEALQIEKEGEIK